MANKIDPITGLQSIEEPKKSTLKTDPITGESYIPSFSGSPLARPQPITTQYSDNISKYQKYNVPLRQEFDWNEQRAQRQSTTEKWGHGLLKAGVTTVGSIADNTLGVLEGIGGAIVTWDADKFYDTNIGGLIDKTNNWMQENVPNYYTEAERNSTALESLGYANFWADKVANGLGYAIGSIGTVYLTGGMGLASRGISAASKGLKTYRAAKAISGGVKTEEAIRRGAAFGKFQNAIQVGEIGAMMSYGESSVEAREVLHRTTEKLTNQRAKELGIHPSELSAADIKEIKDTAAHAGNVAFGLNMAVLSATNLVTFGKMLLPKYTNMRPAVKAISKNSKTGKFADTWAESPLWKTTAERYLKVPAVSSVSETFQEGTQFAIQEAADKISNSGKGSVEDWTEAMIEGYGETFGTKEGQESMMLGFIVGGLMGGGGSFRQRLNKAEEDKGRKQIVDALNSDSFVNTIDSAQTLLKASEASQRMQVALEEGDHKAYRDAQFDLIAQQIKFHEARGSMDLFMEKIDDAAKLPDSEFAAAFGIPEGVKFDKAEIIAGVKSKIKDYQTLKDQVDAQFPSRPKQGIERTFMSKKQKEQEENELQDERFYKSLLLEYGLNLNDSNKRVSSLIEEINQLLEEAGPVAEGEKITEEDLNLITTFAQRKEGEKNEQQEAIDAKLKNIQDKVSSTNPLFTEVIESKIKDLVDLSNGRDIARSALKELYADPKTRKTALDRAKRAEKKKENDKRDSLVREKINESANSDHIAELLKSEDISEELKQELNGEYNQRVAKERELDNELYYKTLEEVEEMLKEGISNNADPFKLWVMKRHVSSRRKSGEVNAREKKESTKTEDRKAAREERKAKREEEKKALREEQEKDAEEAPSSSADTVTSSEENAPTGETVTTTAGEFNTDASYNLIVDSNGKVTVGRDSNQPSSIDRSISQREGLEGTEVELKLLDPVQTEGGEVQAVGVFVDGNLAGVLGESSAVKVRPRLEAGETVNGEVSERYFNNVNNLRTETGEKVFLPANEALQGLTGFVGYAIYAGSIEGETSPRYDFGDQKGVTEASNALNKGSRANDAGFTPGQVVLVVKTPRGEFKPIAVSTNELGRESVGAVLDSLSEGTLQGIIDARELAGITKKEDSPSAFTISQSGVISMPFKGEIIEITPEELAAIRAEIYNPERAELTPEVLEALKTTIAELKTQVALENLGIDSTYLSPITNKSYNSYREYIEAEVLRTDFKVINGSIFNNVGLVISLGAPANKNQIIEAFSFDEEASTAERDITTESESEGKEASGKFGDGLLRLSGEALNTIDTKKAKAWLQKRFGKKVGIIIFDNLQKIGDDVIHGYMENAAIHLYRNAEVGTEYHEGFHLFFRGLLTDEQRQSLYDDAVAEFGEPTADDIKNARRGKPDLSNKEARLLALEERMAEEFRDYSLTEEAPKTLGQKIAKFFKDLLAYIKALATDRVSVRQAFRLLEANKIPKAFTRNASTFSPGKSYMLKEYTQTPRLHKEKIDLILYNTLNLLDSGNFTIEELIGNTEDKDSMLKNWFLRHALSKEGEPLTSEDFETFKETYDSAENVEDVKKVMSDLGIKVSPPMTDFSGNPLPGKTAGSRRNGLRFIAIYDNWFDTESELGGLPIKGFRSEVADRLKTDFGYKVLDTTEVDTESEFERLFSLSRLEEEPAKKLSQKAKRVLSRIPVQDLSDSFFGFQTYMPITDVFNELSGAVADSSNLEDMLENLKQQKNSVNSLNAVYDFVIGLGAQEQALLFSTLSLGMNAHRTLLISQTDNGAQTIIFSPVKATIKKYYTNKWRNSAVGGTGVYSTVVNDKGDFVGYTVDPATISEIQKNAKVLFEGLENPGAKEIEAFSNALWAMGMPLASSKAASRKRALEVFSIDGRYKENLEVFIKSTQLESILTQKFAPGKNSYTNIFETESTTVGKIADMIMSKFESPKAASFLGGTGNMIYALNLKSDLTITKEMIRTGEYGEMFVNAIGHQTERTSSLGTTLLNNLNYQELFEPIDLDASKFISEEGEDTKEYSNMTFEDALAISLNMAFPSSGNVRYIAIDTQGDRDRLTFVPIPKWEQRKVKGLFDLNQTIKQGTFRESTRSIIENYVLLDLHRISKELTMENRDELMTYHTEDRFRSLQVGGELDASQDSIAHDAASYMDNPNTEMPEELMKFLDSKVEEVLSNFEEYYNEIVKKVGGEYNLKQLVINKVDNRSYIKGKETDLVKSFIVHDMIGRLVSREIFRTGINHVKNGADYNKRSALTTTPGTILMIAGSSSKNRDYGMSPTFNEITVKDIYTSLPKKQLKNLKKALTKQVGKDEANKIIKAYTRSNSTDAQAFISPSMYRNIRMGMGLWSKEDQEIYENYVNTGKWTGSIMPLKPSYEFRVKHQGRIIPISHKNSYIVLTRELAEGNTTLSTLLDRMEAVNEFEGLSPVDVVNVESAKKTGSFAPIDAEDANALASSPVMVLDSRGLKFPQILPEKNSYQITFGRQPRKNMIANIGRENNYFIEGVKVSGEELFNIYQEAITAKLQKNTDKVLKRLGYDKVLNAKNADERLKALNDLLPKLQEVMTEMGIEKDYPQNILDALEIVKDENGNLSTAIPLAFPQVQSKLQQLLFGMFRREIYQQKMLGMEMVQFSEFAGKSEVDNSLKFYDVKGEKVTAVEVDIRYDVLERLGIDPSLPREQISEKLMTLIGYRIPQQGKSSTLIMKVRNILPASHKASIRVPGAVTTMMGSDFDIDKMFILFPEAVVKEDGSIDKVSINYSRLKKSKDFSRLSLKQLNNIIFDSIVAVGTSINHLSETVAPLDIVDIEEAREAIGKSKENIDINNPGTRLQTGVDNMLSGILRGIYANGVAGRNVAEASNVVFEGLPIVVDGISLSSIVTKSPFTGKYTDYYLSQYLSAAVDSVKDPIQAAINDNALTAPLTIYMLSIGMTPKQIVAFLNVPIVKAQIDEAIKTQKSIKQLLSDFDQNERMSLNTETMLKIGSGEITKYDRTEYLRNLKTIALQAESLDRLYRTISPDSIDKAGTIPQHLAKLDVKSSAEASSPVFGGSEALASLTEEDSYKIVRGYYEAISKSLDLAADLGFISNQKAVQNFKNNLKSISGRQTLTPEMHRDINRALLHHLVTKPGSPIFESDLLLETKVLYNHMEGGLESLLSDMKEITEGTSNAVVESLIIETTETQKGEFSKYSLDVDKVNTTLQKNYFTATLKGMMDNPSLYGEENKETVEKFVEAFVSNSIVTSGFAPSPTATFSLVPVEYFKRLKVGEHIRNEIKNLESDTAFPMSVEEFIINYGYQKFGGKYIFKTPYKGNLDNTISLPDRRDVYVIANKKNKETKVITTAVYVQVTEGVYERIQTKGQQKLLYEANLKSSDGRPVRMDRSIINPIITSEITPSTGRTIPRGTPVQPIQQTSQGTSSIIQVNYNFNPSNVSEETRNEYKKYVLDILGNPLSVEFESREGDSLYKFTFKDGIYIETPAKGKMLSWPNGVTNKIAELSKEDEGYGIKFGIGLNKIAEEQSTQQTSEVKSENISSKGSEFAKKLTNPGNNLKVTYKGREFRNAEHAYQTYKSGEFDQKAYDSNAFKPVGSKPANRKTNYQTMVDILKAKLEQHSELIEGINQRGGLAYIEQSTHNVTGDKFWESKGQNKFIEALADAYKSIQPAQQTSEVKPKEGLPELFNNNSELSSIGTEQQYSAYLDTVFPDSKVKDIVYHHSSQKLEKFDKSFLGKETSAADTQLGFFFAEDKNDIPEMVAEKNKQLENMGESRRLNFSIQNNVLLNIKNPEFYYGFIEEAVSNILGREARVTSKTAKKDYREAKLKLENNNKDALIYGLAIEPDGEGGTDVNKGYVVFEPEQIHILGSKQDVEGFKKFVATQQPKKSKPLTASESNTIEKDIENTVTESLREKIFRIGKVPFEKTEFENINVLVKKINDNEFSIAVDNKGKNIFGLVSAVLDFQRRDLDNNSIYAPNPKGFILWETFLNSEVGSSSKAKTIIDNRFSITLGTLKALKNNGIEFINFPERFAEDFKNEYSQFLEQDLSSVGFTDVTDKRIKTIRISIDNLIRAISLKNNNQQAAAQQPNKSKISLLEKETPHGSAQKISRLRENFAAAGIDVTVVEAELPPGEKGQVVGDLIVIDPNQIEADTVYHEFGHILVDMLPEDEVDAYIEQVKKANPELVDIVTAKYPELSGRDLGKEILVTAIGLEGARIERKSPSKLQRIVNKILRALGKLFGVKPNAASILAERMFAGEIRAEMLTGSFNPKVQKSKKLQDDITKTFEEVTITLKRQLIRIENLPETEKTKSRIREIKTLQKNLSNIEENMSDMSQFLNFQQYVVARVDTLEVLMDKIYDLKDQKLSSKEALQVLRNIGEIKETIDSLYNTEKDKSTIHKMKKLMRNIPFGDRTSLEVAEVRMDLEDAIDRLEDLEQDYQDIILPLVADTLLTFGDTSINDSLDKEIERVRRTKDISSFRRFSYLNKNPEYLALKKKRKDMTPEEYKDAMVEVKINDLKSKRLGRDQIIAELRDAHASKGRFSYYLDPMVYSNEANMQLFALSIKDAINNANEKSRGFLYLLEKQYSKFKDWKGKDFNEQEFNDDLLTTTTITRADGSTIKLLSLVQEYDVEDFYSKRNETIERLNKTYKKPTEVSELSKWRKSNNGKLHREELSKWYKENTTKIKGAEKILSDMRLRTSQITKEINDLPEDNLDAKNILKNELSELINKIKNSYRGGVFMGDLAAPSEKYKSDKYKKIMATPELKEYYDFVVQSYHASQKKIGRSELFVNSWDKYSYVMPSIRKDLLAALQQEGWIDLANENIKDFRRLETDTQFGVMTNADGGKVKSIPRFYTNQVSHEQVSRDIASSLAQFTHMANTFEEKSNVVGLVETMLTLHENRKTLSIDAVTGLPIIDNIASRVKKEGNSYVLKPGVENNAYKHLQEFVDSVFYGQFDIDEGSLFGANISKLAGKAAALTATANLAFNSLQIGNQFILDNLMSAEEAVAGQFYSKSDYAWAVKTYAQMKGALGDLGKFVPKSKLGQAMQMFDALNEVSDTIGKNLTGNKLKKAMQSDPLFAIQHAVEHQSTGTRLLALLHSTKVTDENNKAILNEDGSEANLWDMLIKDKNGKLIIDPRVKNIDKNRIISKLHGINKRTNQVKGSFDRSMGSRRALGKMLLLFRNYFIPGLRKRFGHGEAYHVDHELGDITRGMYLSVISYIGSIAEGGGVASSYQMMSETDKQNLKRSLYEAFAAMTTAIVFGMLNSMIDMDDDDEDSYALVYSAYQARRLQTELLQFINPGEFMHIIESPMATVNWASKYYDIITQVTLKEPGYFLGLVDEDKIFYQRRTGTAEKGDRKVFNKIKKVVPVLNGWQTSFLTDSGSDAVKEKIRWFEQ